MSEGRGRVRSGCQKDPCEPFRRCTEGERLVEARRLGWRMPELGLGPWGLRGGAGAVNVNRPEGLSTDRLWAVIGREDIKKIKQPQAQDLRGQAVFPMGKQKEEESTGEGRCCTQLGTWWTLGTGGYLGKIFRKWWVYSSGAPTVENIFPSHPTPRPPSSLWKELMLTNLLCIIPEAFYTSLHI